MTDLLRFRWMRDSAGYEFSDKHFPATGDTLAQQAYTLRYLVGRSGRHEHIYPMKGNRALFMELAHADPNEEGLIDFCNEFGLLYDSANTPDGWARAVSNMKKTLQLARDRKNFWINWNLAEEPVVRAAIKFGPSYELELQPNSLLDAAYLQLAIHVAGKGKLHSCEHCAKPFISGAGTDRRETAKYCGTPCRQKAYRASQRS